MDKKIYIAIGAVALVAIGIFAWMTASKPPQTVTLPGPSDSPDSSNALVIGEVQDISASARVITVRQVGSSVSIALRDDASITNESSASTTLSYLRRGFTVRAYGTRTDSGSLLASRIEVEKAPAIIVYQPRPNDTVSTSSIRVTGIARVFENQFEVRLVANGKKVFEKPVRLLNGEMGSFGDFDTTLSLAPYAKVLANATSTAVEAFEYSAKDGSEINKVVVPVILEQSATASVKVYLMNSKLDPAFTCTKVFPVTRMIPKTASVANAVLAELLKGPTDEEKKQGYDTSINQGTKLQSVTVDGTGTARADFDQTLQQNVGGSCRIASIRAQITQTLKQFPTVRQVVISINGDSETILQP